MVYVAAKLGIADLLAREPMTCHELALRMGASDDALCRLMRGLVSMGVFEETPDHALVNTEISRSLRSDVEGSVREGVVFLGQEQYQAWGDLLTTVMTGEPGFKRLFGEPFQYYEDNPNAARAFDSFMTFATIRTAVEIALSYDFPETGTVVDVGGGEGQLLAAVLQSRPRLRGIVFDRPPVVEKARMHLGSANVIERCEARAGDFRVEVPAGGDVYVLKNVLHDWDDSGAIAILSACRRAMKDTSRLVVIQRAPSGALRPDAARSFAEQDLMQMVYTGGRERTLDEYRGLLEVAGMRVHSTMQSGGVTWLIEAELSRELPPNDVAVS
jgi:hypothetical protein